MLPLAGYNAYAAGNPDSALAELDLDRSQVLAQGRGRIVGESIVAGSTCTCSVILRSALMQPSRQKFLKTQPHQSPTRLSHFCALLHAAVDRFCRGCTLGHSCYPKDYVAPVFWMLFRVLLAPAPALWRALGPAFLFLAAPAAGPGPFARINSCRNDTGRRQGNCMSKIKCEGVWAGGYSRASGAKRACLVA